MATIEKQPSNASAMPRRARDSMRFGVESRLALAAIFCCCGTHPKVAPDPETSGRTEQQSTALPFHSELEGTIAQIARLRGWRPGLSVDVCVASSDSIADAMLADARSQMSANVQEAQSQFLAAFGWAPLGFDLGRDVLGRFARDVSGLYCITSRQILLSENADPRLARRALRHELVHAFQDAEYGLGSRIQWQTDRGDYIAAIHSLAEGEATCIERALDDPLQRGCMDPAIAESVSDQAELGPDSLPGVIRRSLAAPYVDGTHYVARLLREGGWPALDRAWNGGLVSTRQLRQQTAQQAAPLPIGEPEEDMGECELRYVDLIGEQGLRSLVGEVTDTESLQRVLASLLGERAAIWDCDGTCVAVMRLRFEHTTDSRRFGKWLGESAGLSVSEGAVSCRPFRQRAVSYYAREQDIAIASVLPCHGQIEANWADTCPLAAALAVRLADP